MTRQQIEMMYIRKDIDRVQYVELLKRYGHC